MSSTNNNAIGGDVGVAVVGVLKNTPGRRSTNNNYSATKQFKPSHELQSKKSSFRSVVFATNDIIFNYNTTEPASSTSLSNKKRKKIDDTIHEDNNATNKDTNTERTIGMASDASESKYWLDSFGLFGGSVSQGTKLARRESSAKFAHPRAVEVDAASASVIHEIHFHPTAGVDLTKQSTTLLSSNGGLKPVSSNNCAMAVVAGPRVQLYGTTFDSTFHRTLSQHSTTIRTTSNINADKQVPTGGQLAISACFRSDGRLVAIGTDQGTIRITDCATRATITQFTNPSSYKLPIRSVQWFRDGQHLLSAGDDATIRIWQLKYTVDTNTNDNGVGRPILECIGHGDSIRCAILWQLPEKIVTQQKNNTIVPYPYTTLAATGSYDHTIRLWNLDDLSSTTKKVDRCVSILEHGAPVEALLWVSSGITNSATIPPVWLLSAGGTTIKVWNPMNGTCITTIETQHRKTITCLLAMPRIYGRTLSSSSSDADYRLRILSGGLDGFIRVHTFDRDNGRVQFVHGIYDSSITGGITSLAASPAADRIAIGTTKGNVIVRQKGPSIVPHKRLNEPRAGTFAFFTRGMNATPIIGDQIADGDSKDNKKRKLGKHDLALKQFRYGDALDEAFHSRNPTTIVAVMEELGKRHGLRIALSNRDEGNLEPLLSFLIRYITNPKYSELLIGVTKMLLSIYGSGSNGIIGHSDIIDELLKKLRMVIHKECRIQKSIFKVIGKMDAIMTAAEMDELYTYRNK